MTKPVTDGFIQPPINQLSVVRMKHIICIDGIFPMEGSHVTEAMIGEIRCIASNRIPDNWMECNGQQLPIGRNYESLFSVIGTAFGGNGTTFNLPNLNNRVIMHSDTPSSTPTVYTIQPIAPDTITVVLDESFNIYNNIIPSNI
jgi:microcystin-dependent protein